jgi:hypothetical protein
MEEDYAIAAVYRLRRDGACVTSRVSIEPGGLLRQEVRRISAAGDEDRQERTVKVPLETAIAILSFAEVIAFWNFKNSDDLPASAPLLEISLRLGQRTRTVRVPDLERLARDGHNSESVALFDLWRRICQYQPIKLA